MDPTTFGPQTARTIYDRVIANPKREQVPGRMQSPTVDPGAPIRFRNGSNESVPPFGCMKVTGAELDASTNRYVVVISKPDGAGGDFRFNGPYAVEAGGYGSCYLSIVKAAYVSTETPAFGQYWGPTNTWEVESSGTPAIRVLGDLENNQLFGMALTGDPVTVKVVPDNDVNPGGSTACVVYTGQPPAPTTQTIPAVYLDWESGQEQVSSGKESRAMYEPSDGVWRFVSAECETDEEPITKIGAGDTLPSAPTTYSSFILFDGLGSYGIYENIAGTLTEATLTAPITVSSFSSTSTLTAGVDLICLCDTSGGAFTLTLPTTGSAGTDPIRIKKVSSDANLLTIDGNGAETIDGSTTQPIGEQYESLTLIADSSNSRWVIV